MRKREQNLWQALKRNAPSSLWLQRIENLIGAGMPDVYVGANGKWIELKEPPRIPAREGTPLLGNQYGLNVDQINWHVKRAMYSEAPETYILIRTIENYLLLMHGSLAYYINTFSLKELTGHAIYEGFRWEPIIEELLK